jgi:hypothetical protein
LPSIALSIITFPHVLKIPDQSGVVHFPLLNFPRIKPVSGSK